MFVGDKKNPLIFGRKGQLLADYLDEEFYALLDDAYMHISGFRKISADDENLTEAYIYSTRYLVLYLMQDYGCGKL